MAELSEYPVFDGVEFKPEVKELMKLFAEAWEQCRATACGECHYRHGKEWYSLMACLCERYAEKMLDSGYRRVWIEEAPTIDAVPVVRCEKCVLHGNCVTEDAFALAGIEHPFCCAGKRKEGADHA